MSQHPDDGPRAGSADEAGPGVDPTGETVADETTDAAPVGVPPVPGPPPGVPDPDWPDAGRPPINLGVMDPG